MKVTESMIKQEFENNDDIFDYKLLYAHSITDIERTINNFTSDTIFSTVRISSKQIFPDRIDKEFPIKAHILKGSFLNMYQNIRQKTIDLIMTI